MHYCWLAQTPAVTLYRKAGRQKGNGFYAKRWLSGKKEFAIYIFRAIRQMRRFPADLRRSGKTIAFVPTMGFLHQGHVSLMEKGKSLADHVVVSIDIVGAPTVREADGLAMSSRNMYLTSDQR